MKYLACEMEYRCDFNSDNSEVKPVRVIQMINTSEEASLLLSQLYDIGGIS